MHLGEDRVRDEAMVGEDDALAQAFVEDAPHRTPPCNSRTGTISRRTGGGFR